MNTAQAGQNWAQQALPPGWEAKYDPGQRRYFYINHSTQTTSWEDPRAAYYQQQQQLFGMARAVEDKYNIRVNTLQVEDAEEAASTAGSRPESPHPSQPTESPAQRTAETSFIQGYEEKIQKLRTMFPTADETIIKQFLIKNNNNEGATIGDLQGAGFQRQDATSVVLMANRIKRDFPSAEAGMIRDILHGVSNDESKARQELKSLGYEQAAPTSNTLSANRSTRGISPSRSGSSSRINTPSAASKKTARKEEVPKEVNKTARLRLKQTMAKEFPDQGATTIEMACDVCHYDEMKVRTLLQSMATTQQAKNIVSSSSLGSKIKLPLDDISRMGLNVDSEGRKSPSPAASGPSTSAATASVFTYPDIGSSLSAITGSSAMSSGVGHTSAISSSLGHTSGFSSSIGHSSGISSTRGQTSAFSSMHTSAGPTVPTPRPARTRAVTTTQPSGSGYRPPPSTSRDTGSYHSSMLTQTQGPNSQLAKGPDRSILIKDYCASAGPSSTALMGPNRALLQGRIGGLGPDRSLRAGPSHSSRCGPNPGLLGHRSYGANRLIESHI